MTKTNQDIAKSSQGRSEPRALITGGAGFVGSHLTERLLTEGYDVTILDDLSTGSRSNLDHPNQDRPVRFVHGDVLDAGVVDELVSDADYVFHLAASVGVRKIIDSPVEAMINNIRGTEVILEAAARWNKVTVVASTSEVYGKSDRIPFSETDDMVFGPTHNLRWSYAAAKAIDEFLALGYARDRDLPVIVVRLFNTVGPRQTGRYGMVIPTFVRQALGGQSITVHGDGTQRRAFAHVSDAVHAIYRLSRTEAAHGEVFNVGNDVEISIMELAELVKEKAKSKSEIVTVPYEDAFDNSGFEDIPRRVPDLGKVKKLIGYQPAWGIEEIVEDVVAYFRLEPAFR